ncbi:MAG: DNA-binding protein [Nitrosomonas sp.]|uniref:DNA-binding protein n=1 Tax=Nitrosomonas sp. TaxID=42353 RepID=UPI00273702C6|nr:DNA-binding protein [Nitrosomonas sp.]MDP3279954.1 DNA-binding protein [Nitrosomonas sp.]MDP3663841.1 DNA-binding protein [Nitrosomonas sp.]MDZ4105659.1 DNA-binding protein [Nitrosomonas sp.]
MQPTSKNQFSALSNQQFQSLDQVTRSILTTGEAAFYLNRKPQTLRCWAMKQDGLLQPVRINSRLGWRVADIKSLLNGGV